MEKRIETDHLVLRFLKPSESIIVSSFYSRNFDDFAKYEPLTRRQSLSTRYQYKVLELEERYRREGKRVRYYMFRKYDPFRTIGTVSFRELDSGKSQTAIVGYKVDLDFRRQGYARETLETLIPLIESEYGIRYIKAEVLTTNTPSQNLLQGLGFRRTAMLSRHIQLGARRLDEYLYVREDDPCI